MWVSSKEWSHVSCFRRQGFWTAWGQSEEGGCAGGVKGLNDLRTRMMFPSVLFLFLSLSCAILQWHCLKLRQTHLTASVTSSLKVTGSALEISLIFTNVEKPVFWGEYGVDQQAQEMWLLCIDFLISEIDGLLRPQRKISPTAFLSVRLQKLSLIPFSF